MAAVSGVVCVCSGLCCLFFECSPRFVFVSSFVIILPKIGFLAMVLVSFTKVVYVEFPSGIHMFFLVCDG